MCCRPQAYDIVIEQVRRLVQASGQTLGWSLAVSLVLAFWSATAGTQALFAALNIAYEEPERRSLFQFYLSAFTFTLVGILGGVIMMLAIVYVPIWFGLFGYSARLRAFWSGSAAGRFWRCSCCASCRCSTAMGRAAAAAKWHWVTVGSSSPPRCG